MLAHSSAGLLGCRLNVWSARCWCVLDTVAAARAGAAGGCTLGGQFAQRLGCIAAGQGIAARDVALLGGLGQDVALAEVHPAQGGGHAARALGASDARLREVDP
ncbi:hypothetical protein [Acidovorax sp. A1169]|uniref:hypothetical protein n=1 Tax=Acidovorax sp. A1169 TaxID=3059524 RepID=UPI003521EB59